MAGSSSSSTELRAETTGRPLDLAGHSFGTVLGDLIASRAPERLAATSAPPGDRDRITDLAQIRTWFDGLQPPSKRFDMVEGTGHLNLFEAPDRFVAFMTAIRSDLPG